VGHRVSIKGSLPADKINAGRLSLRKKRNDQYCNLCLQQAVLTKDHVPTKGWGNSEEILVERFQESTFIDSFQPRLYQGGVYYQTICRKCNNEILGSVDEAIAEFASICKMQFENQRRVFQAKIRPNAILRAILGHVVSVRLHTDRSETTDTLIRDYLIHGKPLSPRIRVYVWPFLIPKSLRIARDFVYADARNREISGICSVIKFYPIAVVIQLDGNHLSAPSFHEFSTLSAVDHLLVPLDFSTQFDPRFPEQAKEVDPHYVVVAGKGYADGIEAV